VLSQGEKEAWVAGMSAISRSDGSTHSVDTKMAFHVAKAAGERKHGTVSSKRRGVQKAKLGIASPHSSLNLGCFRTVGGPFGTWLGPFRDLVGALSGLGWGAFARFRWGAFRSTQGKKKKQQARNAKQAPRALSFCLVGLAHTRRVHAVQK
jgi:hypothetical protein